MGKKRQLLAILIAMIIPRYKRAKEVKLWGIKGKLLLAMTIAFLELKKSLLLSTVRKKNKLLAILITSVFES